MTAAVATSHSAIEEGSRPTGLVRFLGRDGINSAITWLVLVCFLVVCRVLIYAFFPTAFNDPNQASFFSWPALAILGLAGLVGVYFAHLTGFPAAWSIESPAARWLAPLAIGVAFGVGYIVFDKVANFTALNNAHHGVATQFVGVAPSVLIFSGGAIISEVVFRLFPVPLVLWLASSLALRGRWREQIFWGLAILASLLEPVSQYSFLLGSAAGAGALLMTAGFTFNMVQARYFRKYGFLSAIAVRVAFYIIWHVAYVH